MSDNENKQLPVHSPGHTPPLKQRAVWPLWLLMLLLLVAATLLGWHQWQITQQQQQSQSRLQEELDRVETQTRDLRQDLRSSLESREQRLNRLETRLDEKADQQQRMQRQIEHNARSLLGLGQRTRTDWLLAEAEYLMRLANQRLFFEGDYRGALAMLESADQVLSETDDVGSYPVRKALSREILALKGIEPVDRAGLYLKLDAAISQLESLNNQALTGYEGTASPADTEGDGQTRSEGDNPWRRILDTLSEIVVIQRMDEPLPALPSPMQSTQARLHLRLMLEEAGIAVLRRDQTVYQRALARAQEWLQQWYQQDSPGVKALQQTLRELSEKRIDPPLPRIDESLNLLKQRIAGRLEQREKEEPQEEQDSQPPQTDSGETTVNDDGESGS
ncbi:MAG: uroporphyrinogen-III C-methyltransferase [Oleiphilaceae bacterium]|nr:uroporphyrinogen-III C-methyltransferase [Oleiphilaceae bacterium]